MTRRLYILLLCLAVAIAAAAQERMDSVEARNVIQEAAEAPLSYQDSLLMAAQQLAKADSLAAIDRSVVISRDSVAPVKQRRNWNTWKPDIKRALWLALVIPGGGQIYNRKYWKLPIVYGGFLGCIYALRWNGQMYEDYMQAYQDLSDDDPTTKSYEKFLHFGQEITDANKSRYLTLFKNRKDKYRRWRDMSIFVMIGVYALSVIDAYVDASLSQFDITEDLSLKVTPAVMDSRGHSMMAAGSILNSAAVGVNCSLNF